MRTQKGKNITEEIAMVCEDDKFLKLCSRPERLHISTTTTIMIKKGIWKKKY